MPEHKDTHKTLFCPRSAIDVSTGFGAEAFLLHGGAGPVDPWAQHCFISLAEALLNHPEFRYPFPSNYGVQSGKNTGLPALMVHLHNAGLLQPDENIIAENVTLSNAELDTYFNSFQSWATNRKSVVKRWIEFHSTPDMKKKHKSQMPTNFNTAVQVYFEQDRNKFKRLGRSLGVSPKRAVYAFDVAARGKQYASLLGVNANYYSHPIRNPILSAAECRRDSFKGTWSWGRNLAWAVSAERLRREPEEMIGLLGKLKHKIASLGGTIPELAKLSQDAQQELLNDIAAETGLPSVLREDVHDKIESFFVALHLGMSQMEVSAIHFSVAAGNLIASRVDNVPGAIIKHFRFFRGLVEYPYLGVAAKPDNDSDPD